MENKKCIGNQGFLWYLSRGVVLTKDNLAKCNWQGSKQCCFCRKTIKRLFFECCFACPVWYVIHAASMLPQPRSLSNMFGLRLWGHDKELKSLALLE